MPAPLRKPDGTLQRAHSLPLRMSREEKRVAALVVYPEDVERPRTRGDCEDGMRPCPFVSCKYHLYLDVSDHNGRIKVNFPHLEVEELQESCALDVADRGGITLEEVGNCMNITRERIRQVEMLALAKSLEEDVEFDDQFEGRFHDADAEVQIPTMTRR